METKLTISELTAKVVEELTKLGYSYNSLCGFRSLFRRFQAFAQSQGEEFFPEELGKKFLEERYGCTVNYYLQSYPQGTKHAIRSIRLLGDYQLHGVIIRRIVKKPGYVKPPQFEHILTAYEQECQANEYSRRGMRSRQQRLFFFVDYLALRGIQEVNEITPLIISDYVKTIFPHHEKSIAAILTTLRVFLRFLYQNGYTTADLSVSVPKQSRYYYPSLPLGNQQR